MRLRRIEAKEPDKVPRLALAARSARTISAFLLVTEARMMGRVTRALADDIGGQDRPELAALAHPSGIPAWRRLSKSRSACARTIG